MSDTQPKGIKEGPPIWVESLMTREEWKERYKKYSTSSEPEPPQWDKEFYKGGKWRNEK